MKHNLKWLVIQTSGSENIKAIRKVETELRQIQSEIINDPLAQDIIDEILGLKTFDDAT